VSILIFGLYGVLTLFAYRTGLVDISFSRPGWLNAGFDMLILVLWYEVHFYLCHRLLHTKFLYKKVHLEHHRSYVSTPFSAFSFHWFEAVLLSSVMILAMFVYTFHVIVLILFPVVSLLFNNFGHMNYDLFPDWKGQNIITAIFTATR